MFGSVIEGKLSLRGTEKIAWLDGRPEASKFQLLCSLLA